MSKLPLDMSKFKKIKSNARTSVFQHDDGHQITIAHEKLSDKMRSALEKLPMIQDAQNFDEGGKVQEAPLEVEPISPDSPDAQPAQSQPLDVAPDVAAPAQEQAPAAEAPVAQAAAQQEVASNAPVAQSAPQQQQASDPQQDFVTQKMAHHQELSAENQAWEQDLNNGHIKPETYHDLFEKKSTLGKIGTIFGLMVSGAGAGLTHQSNALLDQMNKEINNDLDAQKQSKGNAQNFLKLNQANELNRANIKYMGQQGQLSNAQAAALGVETKAKAYALAQAQMRQASYHHLVEQVSKMPEGQQKEAAKQQLALIYNSVAQSINNINDQAAGAAAYSNLLFGDQGPSTGTEQGFQNKIRGMKMLGPQGEARAKDLEEKHFPGLEGQASIPLTSADRDSINSGMEFDQKLNRFINWTQNHSGDLSPADKNEGIALASEVQGGYRQATHGGVYKEGEQNFISKIVASEPTKFFNNIRVIPQLKAIANENRARVNQLVKSKGFPGYNPDQGSSGPQYKMSGGVKYMRGPNGEAIPVK